MGQNKERVIFQFFGRKRAYKTHTAPEVLYIFFVIYANLFFTHSVDNFVAILHQKQRDAQSV